MGLFFGTDGLRGKVNDDLSAGVCYKCGNALGVKYPNSKIEKQKIIKLLEYKIKKFLRGMSISEKMDYIQDARYSLIMEEQAYRTQLKYAKKLHKKHLPIKDGELDDEISLHMLKEKIKLVTQIGFEVVEKERGKHAAKLKKQKLRNVKANQ